MIDTLKQQNSRRDTASAPESGSIGGFMTDTEIITRAAVIEGLNPELQKIGSDHLPRYLCEVEGYGHLQRLLGTLSADEYVDYVAELYKKTVLRSDMMDFSRGEISNYNIAMLICAPLRKHWLAFLSAKESNEKGDSR